VTNHDGRKLAGVPKPRCYGRFADRVVIHYPLAWYSQRRPIKSCGLLAILMTRKSRHTRQPHYAQRNGQRERTDQTDHAARSIDDLTERNIETIGGLEAADEAARTVTDRMADRITRFAGSMRFVNLHVVWFAAWICFNTLPVVPESWQIDPFPFTFLTFVVSLEAIFLSTFILISQNHEERMTEKRNHLDLQINLLSEQENSKMLRMLEAIHRRLGIAESDPEVELLEEDTHPDSLVKQIEQIIESRKATNARSDNAAGRSTAKTDQVAAQE
jgi:uncharacterized membrane protein